MAAFHPPRLRHVTERVLRPHTISVGAVMRPSAPRSAGPAGGSPSPGATAVIQARLERGTVVDVVPHRHQLVVTSLAGRNQHSSRLRVRRCRRCPGRRGAGLDALHDGRVGHRAAGATRVQPATRSGWSAASRPATQPPATRRPGVPARCRPRPDRTEGVPVARDPVWRVDAGGVAVSQHVDR